MYRSKPCRSWSRYKRCQLYKHESIKTMCHEVWLIDYMIINDINFDQVRFKCLNTSIKMKYFHRVQLKKKTTTILHVSDLNLNNIAIISISHAQIFLFSGYNIPQLSHKFIFFFFGFFTEEISMLFAFYHVWTNYIILNILL